MQLSFEASGVKQSLQREKHNCESLLVCKKDTEVNEEVELYCTKAEYDNKCT